MNTLSFKKLMIAATPLVVGSILANTAIAQTQTRVTVRIENVAPDTATLQTPVWIGLHDGITFDTYNGNTPAGSRPIAGSVNALGQSAMEEICEDGSTAQIARDFATLQPNGVDTTVAGPNGGPIAPNSLSLLMPLTQPHVTSHMPRWYYRAMTFVSQMATRPLTGSLMKTETLLRRAFSWQGVNR